MMKFIQLHLSKILLGALIMAAFWIVNPSFFEYDFKQNSAVMITPSEIPIPTPTSIVTPTVTQPSEKALKVAAQIIVSLNSDQQTTFCSKYNTDIPGCITAIAYRLDSDPAVMAAAEASLQQFNKNQIYVPNTSVNTGTTDWMQQRKQERAIECQKDMAEYNGCLSEKAIALAEYNNCILSGDSYCYKSYKAARYCSKPICL